MQTHIFLIEVANVQPILEGTNLTHWRGFIHPAMINILVSAVAYFQAN